MPTSAITTHALLTRRQHVRREALRAAQVGCPPRSPDVIAGRMNIAACCVRRQPTSLPAPPRLIRPGVPGYARLAVGPQGGQAVDLAGPFITMILGERTLPLTRAEANELHDMLVERNLALLALQSELARALQTDSGKPNVLADEQMRQELLLCLDAADAELQLAEGLRSLRQAARVPISPKPEY